MSWLLRSLGALILIALFLLGIGLLLPSHFHVERSVEIAAPVERVYAAIAGPREWRRWSAWSRRDPEMTLDCNGPPAGVGARCNWHGRAVGSGSIEFTEAVAGQRIGYALTLPAIDLRSHGDLKLDPTGTTVRLDWSNDGEFGSNPAIRWFGPFMDRLVGSDFEAGLRNLKALLEGGAER